GGRRDVRGRVETGPDLAGRAPARLLAAAPAGRQGAFLRASGARFFEFAGGARRARFLFGLRAGRPDPLPRFRRSLVAPLPAASRSHARSKEAGRGPPRSRGSS